MEIIKDFVMYPSGSFSCSLSRKIKTEEDNKQFFEEIGEFT